MIKNKHILIAILVLTNLAWAYAYSNKYILSEYQEGSLKGYRQYIQQLLAIIPIVSTGNATREDIVNATKLGKYSKTVKETDTTSQVDGITLIFDKNNKFVGVQQ